MAANLTLSILTPEKEFFNGQIKEVITETSEGYIGILPDHSPLVATLVPTSITFIEKGGSARKAFTSTGILSVDKGTVKILCDACEWPEDIDVKRAEEAKNRAESRLKTQDGTDFKRAEVALLRSMARIKTK